MGKLTLQLEQQGDDLIVRIPRQVADAAALKAGQPVKLALPLQGLTLEQHIAHARDWSSGCP